MAEWVYFIHAPRPDFAATMSDEERDVWGVHFARLEQFFRDGAVILLGPTLGSTNTGICVFEADDETAALSIMNDDPVISGGYARGELHPFRLSLLRGRDEARYA